MPLKVNGGLVPMVALAIGISVDEIGQGLVDF
jgi:hypothetical protein